MLYNGFMMENSSTTTKTTGMANHKNTKNHDGIRLYAGTGKALCLALFVFIFLLPECQPVSFGLRCLHGLGIFDTGNIFAARGGPWPFFIARDIALPAMMFLAFAAYRAIKRMRIRIVILPTIALGLLAGGIRQCYWPEFDILSPSKTRYSAGFSRNAFLDLPIGLTREEVRARIGDGFPLLDVGGSWNMNGCGPSDKAQCWFMSCYGSDSGNYWRCRIMFDKEGRLSEKSIEWWYD